MNIEKHNVPARLFAFIPDEEVTNGEAFVVAITEWEVQHITKQEFSYLNRELTDIELNRIAYSLAWNNKEVLQLIVQAIRLAIHDALNNNYNRWDKADHKFSKQNKHHRPEQK